MASFSALRCQVFDREERKRNYADHLMGLNAYDRHKKFINDYVLHYGKSTTAVEQGRLIKTDQDTLRETYRFIRTEEDDLDSSWEQRLAKRYYDKLFKEYCIADMAQYKVGKIGMRWRAEKEVISGKGQFVCGNKKCDAKDDLSSYEVNFSYREAGENKQALVKLRVCPECGDKLHYKRGRDRERLKEQHHKDNKRSKSEERPWKHEKSGKKRRTEDVEQVSDDDFNSREPTHEKSDNKRSKSEERPWKHEKSEKKRRTEDVEQVSDDDFNSREPTHSAGRPSLSYSATRGEGATRLTSQEEEYDKYFKGMFP